MGNQEIFSIRMRAAIGGRHEHGGMHISGGEQLCTKAEIIQKSAMLVAKALLHNRGEPDFLQVTVEKVAEPIRYLQPLRVYTNEVENEMAGQKLAKSLLMNAGIKEEVIEQGLAELSNSLETRGAIIIDVDSGERIDGRDLKGVRVSRIDWELDSYNTWLVAQNQLNHIKVKEALALATKVSSHPFTVAELCWSDDPNYVTGYVTTKNKGYQRITCLKKLGDETGGRIYFVKLPSKKDIKPYIHFLEKVPVLLKIAQVQKEEVHSVARNENRLGKG